jgi:hypothetical protein
MKTAVSLTKWLTPIQNGCFLYKLSVLNKISLAENKMAATTALVFHRFKTCNVPVRLRVAHIRQHRAQVLHKLITFPEEMRKKIDRNKYNIKKR